MSKDAIIQMPGAIKASAQVHKDETLSKIEQILASAPPEGSDVYAAMQLLAVPKKLDTKPDLVTGGDRNPKWGMVISFTLLPDLDKVPLGPVNLPVSPSQFITADTIEDIRARVMFELDRAMELSKIAEADPEGYAKYEQAMMQQMVQANAAADTENVGS